MYFQIDQLTFSQWESCFSIHSSICFLLPVFPYLLHFNLLYGFQSVLLTLFSRSCMNILNKDGCVTDSWSFPSDASNKLRYCSLSLRNNSHFITRMWYYFCPKYILYAKSYSMVIYAILYKVLHQGVFIVLTTLLLSPKFWQIFKKSKQQNNNK